HKDTKAPRKAASKNLYLRPFLVPLCLCGSRISPALLIAPSTLYSDWLGFLSNLHLMIYTLKPGDSKMYKRVLFMSSLILVLTLAISCGPSEQTTNLPPAAPGVEGGSAPAATAIVSGKITFEGTPPPNEKIQMSADPYCQQHAQNPTLETVKVSDGGLENVIVYVKSGMPNVAYPIPANPVEIDQHDCHYVPHVFTMQTNQPLKIKNSDMTLHNIHAWAEKN